MSFEEAMDALAAGHKVKLPEWIGYWFIDQNERALDKRIKVYDRHGDVLDTPYMGDYRGRTDWTITDGLRDFGGAIVALKAGKKVARIGWNGKGMFLWLLPATEVKKEWVKDPMLLEAFGDRETLPCLGSIRMFTATKEVLTGWLASQTDMLAEDWMVLT